MGSRSLVDYAQTDHQREVAQYLESGQSICSIARAFSTAPANIRRVRATLQTRAARDGYAPEHGLERGTPDGFRLRGYSTFGTNTSGEPTWFKVDADAEAQRQALQEAVEALKADITPLIPTPCKPRHRYADLLNAHFLADYHLGALAMQVENHDEDWSIDKAEAFLIQWMALAIQHAPPAHTGLLAELGDFLHWDSMTPETPASRHVLDGSTRYSGMTRAGIRVLRSVIAMMLDKYEQVHVMLAEGNHDQATKVGLRQFMEVLYENEPRVTIDTEESGFYAYEWGATSLFVHHGHNVKFDHVHTVFAAQYRPLFGRTSYSYAHTGHLHHEKRKETSLMTVQQHPTMSARDAYASRHGLASARKAWVLTYSKRFGEVAGDVWTPEMVKAMVG